MRKMMGRMNSRIWRLLLGKFLFLECVLPYTLTTNETNVYVQVRSNYPQRFCSIPDMRMILRKAMAKVNDNNASPHEGIVGAILEVCKVTTQSFYQMLNE